MALSGWPGTAAVSEGSYWYYVEVLAGTQLNVIFNNGVDEQTMGVFIHDKENLYVTVNDEKFASKEEAEATIDRPAGHERSHRIRLYGCLQ